MAPNPYGASCGSSTVVPPRLTRVSLGKLGSPSMRLSDTALGKAPKRTRTREEVEAMERHPAGKRITSNTRKPQPKCTCKECTADEALIDGLEQDADDLLAIVHARIEANRTEEANRTIEGRRAREEHLKLIGDSDA